MAVGFAEENAAQGRRLGPGLDSKITADTVQDTRKHMTRRGSDGLTSLRVYANKAIYSPGTQYKVRRSACRLAPATRTANRTMDGFLGVDWCTVKNLAILSQRGCRLSCVAMDPAMTMGHLILV